MRKAINIVLSSASITTVILIVSWGVEIISMNIAVNLGLV